MEGFAFTVKENNWLGQGKQVGFDAEVTGDSLRGTLIILIQIMTF